MVSSYDPIYCLIRPYWSLMHGALIWCEAQRMSSAMWPFCIQQFHHQHSACLRHNMPMSLIQNHLRENIFWCDNYMYVMYCFPYLDYTPRLCMYIAHCRLHIEDCTLQIAHCTLQGWILNLTSQSHLQWLFFQRMLKHITQTFLIICHFSCLREANAINHIRYMWNNQKIWHQSEGDLAGIWS